MLAGSTGRAAAQDEPAPSRRRCASLAAKGIELYKNAAITRRRRRYFQFAQTGQQSLAAPEQQDLATFSVQNGAALKGRQEGVAQLHQAELAIKQGRAQEAGQFLSTLNANQYLTAAERQQVNDLSRMQTQLTGKAEAPPAKDKDAKALLAAGRARCKAGDLVRGEMLATRRKRRPR